MFTRREFVSIAGAATVVAATGIPLIGGEQKMYGIIAKVTAVAGKREEFIAILLENAAKMPGCLSYIVAKDPTDENLLWVTEAWDSKESHDKSLSMPSVKDAITRGRPLAAKFESFQTEPVGGHGLAK